MKKRNRAEENKRRRLGNRRVADDDAFNAGVPTSPFGQRDSEGVCGRVYTVEIIESLARFAWQNLEKAGYLDRVRILHGDGSLGFQENAPYDRIIVTAAAPEILPGLLEQLRAGGILVIPVGGRSLLQQLFRVRKQESGRALVENLGGVAFVPLIGEKGYSL